MPDLNDGISVYGVDTPPSQYDQDWTTISNITTTTYVPGVPEVAVHFTAPTSGRVLVAIGAGIQNNAANADRAIVTYGIYEDSEDGPLIVAPTAYSGIISQGLAVSSSFKYVGAYTMEFDLTPGKSYYARMFYQTILGSGTVDIASRNIAVIPLT